MLPLDGLVALFGLRRLRVRVSPLCRLRLIRLLFDQLFEGFDSFERVFLGFRVSSALFCSLLKVHR